METSLNLLIIWTVDDDIQCVCSFILRKLWKLFHSFLGGFFFCRLLNLCPSLLIRNFLWCSFYTQSVTDVLPANQNHFPAFCCSCLNFFEVCSWHQNQNELKVFHKVVKCVNLNMWCVFYVSLRMIWVSGIYKFCYIYILHREIKQSRMHRCVLCKGVFSSVCTGSCVKCHRLLKMKLLSNDFSFR